MYQIWQLLWWPVFYFFSRMNYFLIISSWGNLSFKMFFMGKTQMVYLVTRSKKGILNSLSLFWLLNCDSQMDSNIQEFSCSPWSFPEMQRCLNYTTCNYYFVDRSASSCAFQCIRSCYIFSLVFGFHGRKQKYFLDIIAVCGKHGDSVDICAPGSLGTSP